MPSARHKRISEIFLAARNLAGAQREDYLSSQCAGDQPLREEVESLLESKTLAAAFFSPSEYVELEIDWVRTRLHPGEMVGIFRLIGEIGHGGMGVVWKAEDTQLGREVALKFLLAAPDEKHWEQRFTQEAQLLGSMKHPGIATAYGLHRASGFLFLSMELIHGMTLAHHLRKGRLSTREGLLIARDLVTAIEESHRLGISHKDLKPANIMLEEPHGKAKILDFGLAGASVKQRTRTVAAHSADPELDTLPGLGGTGPYFTPEQLAGQALQRSVDIWGFGCVMYEMFSGSRAFERATFEQTFNAIRNEEPRWTALPATLPEEVSGLIRRCLQKKPTLRPTIETVREEIESSLTAIDPLVGAPGYPAVAPADKGRHSPTRPGNALIYGLGLAALVALLAWGGALFVRTASPPEEITQEIHLESPHDGRLNVLGDFSPDGTRAVFATGERQPGLGLILRDLQTQKDRLLPGTIGADSPFFSPDGKWLGFFQNNWLMKIALDSEQTVKLCRAIAGRGASWGKDGNIVFTPHLRSGLAWVSEDGGEPHELTTLADSGEEITHRWPHLLPGGRGVLFTVGLRSIDSFDDASVAVHDLHTGTTSLLLNGGMRPQFLAPDRLIFARNGNLYSIKFDLESLKLHGSPEVVLNGVVTNPATGHSYYRIASETGDLIYMAGAPNQGDRVLEWHAPGEQVETLAAAPGRYGFFSLAGNGRRLAVTLNRYYDELWIYDLIDGSRTRLTTGPAEGRTPILTHDGNRVAYANNLLGNEDIYWQKTDGSAPGEVLVQGPNQEEPSGWHPDGETLAYVSHDPVTGKDIHLYRRDKNPETLPFQVTEYNEFSARFSPDGSLIAYLSDELGLPGVYVETYPERDRRILVSSTGVTDLRWNSSGNRLYYLTTGTLGERTLMAAPVESAPDLAIGPAEPVVTGSFLPVFEVDPRGERFLLSRFALEQLSSPQVRLIPNWPESLQGH
jgi:serine/threonine protein kinase/Tol biopolymer transport system component